MKHILRKVSGFKANLSEWLIQLSKNALFIKHLALITVFIVVMDPLAHVSRKLVEGHVLLDLLILQGL